MAFGTAAALVLAGALVGLLVGGFTGGLIAISCVTVGLGAALLLLFLEVGLSEDRERAEEDELRKRREARMAEPARRLRHLHWPRRPG
jgi:hypothetical protein